MLRIKLVINNCKISHAAINVVGKISYLVFSGKDVEYEGLPVINLSGIREKFSLVEQLCIPGYFCLPVDMLPKEN